jgi:O-antigen/teichoic acid export membrane protein
MVRRRPRVAGAAVVNQPARQAALAVKIAAAPMRARLAAAWQVGRRWQSRILFAFVDQGAYSLSNFLLTILLAAWLPLDTFGHYVVLWTASQFIEAIEIALVVDSLPAIFSRHGRRSRARLAASALWVVVGYSIITSLCLVAAAAMLAAWQPLYGSALLVLAVVNLPQRLYLFLRRLAYIHDRQDVAATMAIAYAIVSLAGVFAFKHAHALSLTTAIALWGVGALAAVATAVVRRIGRPRTVRASNVLWLAGEIWRTGRWLSGAALITWISTWAVFPLIAVIGGAGTAGVIRALQNLLTPVVQFNAALHLAILPRVADKVADVGDHYGRWFAWRGTALFAAIAVSYCAVILAAAPLILPALYRKPEIASAAHLLWPLAVAIVCDALRQASTISLVASQRARIVFIARWTALAAFIAGVLVLYPSIGIPGILWATAAASATGAVILLVAALSAKPERR